MISNYEQLFQILKLKGVTNLCSNSQKIEPNCAFFALCGQKYNGNDFINQALSKGAIVAVTDTELAPNPRIIKVQNVKESLQFCALKFYDKLPKNIALVTGTNGKTSVVHYFQQILSLIGYKSASIGTLGCNTNVTLQNPQRSELTTPDFLDLRITLHELAKLEVEFVAIEASSIALTQNRFFNIKSLVTAFTSFASDHLDYHATEENYLNAKLNLFDQHLTKDGVIVIQERLRRFLPKHLQEKHRIVTIGTTGSLRYKITNSSIKGQTIEFDFDNKTYNFSTDIIGGYQAENLLTASMLVHYLGIDLPLIIDTIKNLNPPPGRLERIWENIFIDYAHNEDALNLLLSEVHKMKSPNQKVWLVFGCGGERDSEKRSAMGKVANASADVVIVTDDNPRNEDPKKIRAQIINQCPKAIEIPNREKAITYAVNNITSSDAILLIVGKGHETYQILKDEKLPFAEKNIILEAIKTRKT